VLVRGLRCRAGDLVLIFQAGHAGSIPVTRSFVGYLCSWRALAQLTRHFFWRCNPQAPPGGLRPRTPVLLWLGRWWAVRSPDPERRPRGGRVGRPRSALVFPCGRALSYCSLRAVGHRREAAQHGVLDLLSREPAGGDVRASDESTEVLWVAPADLDRLNIHPSIRLQLRRTSRALLLVGDPTARDRASVGSTEPFG
jgi:hypothetical protein